MKTITRRELFRPLKDITDAMNPRKEEKVDTVSELASEVALVAAALWVAFEGGKDKLISVTPTPVRTLGEDQEFINRVNQEVLEITNGLDDLKRTISQLQDNWRSVYRKSRMVPVTKYDDDGDAYIDWEKEYYWEEPNELTEIGLNHSRISDLSSLIGTINNTSNNLRSNIPHSAAIYIDGGDSYRFSVSEIDLKGRNITATLGLGGSATLFAFYEEILTGLIENRRYSRTQKLSEKAIKRRSFLKVMLGSMALIPTAKLHKTLVSENAVVERRVKASTRQSLEEYGSIDDLKLFEMNYGNSIDKIIQQLDYYYSLIDTAVDTGSGKNVESWSSIVNQLTMLRSQLIDYKNQFEDQFKSDGQLDVPANLALGMRNLQIHRQVLNQSFSINKSPGINAFFQTLTFAGLLCGVAFSSEAIIAVQDEITKAMS